MSVRLAAETFSKLEQLAFEERRKTGRRVSYSLLLGEYIDAEHQELLHRRKSVLEGKVLPWKQPPWRLAPNGSVERHVMPVRFEPATRTRLEELVEDASHRATERVSCSVLIATLVERRHAKLGRRRKQLTELWAPKRKRTAS
jgi:hypothetical protein